MLTNELEKVERSLQEEFESIRKRKEKADKELEPEVLKLEQMRATVEMMKVRVGW